MGPHLAGAVLVAVATLVADTTAPTITCRTPGPKTTGVSVDSSVTVAFSEPLDPASVSGLSMYLLDGSKRVPAVVSLSDDATQMVLDPSAPLRSGFEYVVNVVGGEGAVTDVAGNPLAERARWTFTTNAAPRAEIVSPAPGSVTRDRTPTISFRVRDREGRLPKSGVRTMIDGSDQGFTYKRGTGTLSPRLKAGSHTVLVVVTDAVGVSTTKEWSFRIRRAADGRAAPPRGRR